MTTPKSGKRKQTRHEQDERFKRMAPERTGPIRHAGTAFRPPEQVPGQQAPVGFPPPSTSVEGGVDSAYRVLDDYMSRGRQAAERFSPGPPLRGMAPGMPPMGWNLRDFTLDAMRVWSSMLWSFMELMRPPGMTPPDWGLAPNPWGPPSTPWRAGAFTPSPPHGGWPPGQPVAGPPPPPFARPPGPFATGPQGPPPEEGQLASGLVVSVMQESPFRLVEAGRLLRRVEVVASLQPGANVARLSIEELVAIDDPNKPPLSGVTLQRAGINSTQCFIEIPEKQEPGTYEGRIYEAVTATPFEPVIPRVQGFVRVRIEDLEEALKEEPKEERKGPQARRVVGKK